MPNAERGRRRCRQRAVFAFDRNIADADVLSDLVDGLGLDSAPVVAEAHSTRGEELLRRDIELARELGVRGFPTLVFVVDEGRGVKVSGVKGIDAYVEALRGLRRQSNRAESWVDAQRVVEFPGSSCSVHSYAG